MATTGQKIGVAAAGLALIGLGAVAVTSDSTDCGTVTPTPSPSASPSTPSPSVSPSPSPSGTATRTPLTLKVGTTVSTQAGETKQAAYDRRTADFGVEPEAVRVYSPGAPFWIDLGSAVEFVSFKYAPADVIAGKYDAALHTFFANTPENGELHPWSYWHEPEDDIEDGRFTAAQYRSAFDHIENIAAQYDNADTRLQSSLIVMGWTVNPASHRDIKNYIPSIRPDRIGFDVYPSSVSDASTKYQEAARAALDNGFKRYDIMETGLNSTTGAKTPEQHAEFITKSVQVAAQDGFRFYTYFDATVGGNWLLDTVVEKQAMSNAIKQNLKLGLS